VWFKIDNFKCPRLNDVNFEFLKQFSMVIQEDLFYNDFLYNRELV